MLSYFLRARNLMQLAPRSFQYRKGIPKKAIGGSPFSDVIPQRGSELVYVMSGALTHALFYKI